MAAVRAPPVTVGRVGVGMRAVRRAPLVATVVIRVQPAPVGSAGWPEPGVQSAATVPVASRVRR